MARGWISHHLPLESASLLCAGASRSKPTTNRPCSEASPRMSPSMARVAPGLVRPISAAPCSRCPARLTADLGFAFEAQATAGAAASADPISARRVSGSATFALQLLPARQRLLGPGIGFLHDGVPIAQRVQRNARAADRAAHITAAAHHLELAIAID